jgi:hypothetical protein
MRTRQSALATGHGGRQDFPRQRVLGFAILILLTACDPQEKLPSAPSDFSSGIVIYEHADYLGASAHITQDITHLKDFEGPCLRFESDGSGITFTTEVWDDCMSSVRVAPGWRAVLYRDGDFDGDQMQVTLDIPNLTQVQGDCDKGGFNDCVTSIRVIRP